LLYRFFGQLSTQEASTDRFTQEASEKSESVRKRTKTRDQPRIATSTSDTEDVRMNVWMMPG